MPVLALPVLYLLGFLAWGVHAAVSGLGYLPLDAGRYLATGMATALPTALGLLLTYLLFGFFELAFGRRRETIPMHLARLGTECGALAIAFLLPLLLVVVFGGLFPIFDARITDFAPELAAIGALLLIALYMVFVGTFEGIHLVRRGLRRLSGTEDLNRFAPRSRSFRALAGLAVVTLMAMFIGLLFVPAMNPAFGGAHVREAQLDVDADEMSYAMRQTILPTNEWNATGPTRTPWLIVLFYDSERLVVQPLASSPSAGNLEIDRKLVSAVLWRDDSHLYWGEADS